MSKIKPGDLVEGISDLYRFTGKGSLNLVVDTHDDTKKLLLRCIFPSEPFDTPTDAHEKWWVVTAGFRKVGEANGKV